MKTAIVHPWFITHCGGDEVITTLAEMYPDADIFALMVSYDNLPPALVGRNIRSTFLDRVPKAHAYYQHLSPLYPMAANTLDVTGYDLVISSGGPAAKNVKISPGALHIHYCHSPVRFLWDQFPVWEAKLPGLVRPLFRANCAYLRKWDYEAAQRVDTFITNSDYIADRVRTFYHRDSVTIYPPVKTRTSFEATDPEDHYLSVGRLVDHKRIDLAIEACNRLGRKLVIVGTGPDEARLKAMAGPTISFEGYVDDSALDRHFRSARAYLFAGEEDFGIATVEAQTYGLPVIGFGAGGTLEIVDRGQDGGRPTGVLFPTQDADAFVAALMEYEAKEARFDRRHIWERSLRFDQSHFTAQIHNLVEGRLRATRGLLAAE